MLLYLARRYQAITLLISNSLQVQAFAEKATGIAMPSSSIQIDVTSQIVELRSATSEVVDLSSASEDFEMEEKADLSFGDHFPDFAVPDQDFSSGPSAETEVVDIVASTGEQIKLLEMRLKELKREQAVAAKHEAKEREKVRLAEEYKKVCLVSYSSKYSLAYKLGSPLLPYGNTCSFCP